MESFGIFVIVLWAQIVIAELSQTGKIKGSSAHSNTQETASAG